MKKMNFDQSEQLMKLLALLVELKVVDINSFLNLSVDIIDTTAFSTDDYLDMIVSVFSERGI